MKMNYRDFLWLVHLLMPRAVQAVVGSWSTCQDATLCWCQSAELVLAWLLGCTFSLGHSIYSCFSFTLQ